MKINNLKKYREEKGVTQKELAESAKISERHYQNLERGISSPGIDTARRIADALGQTVDEVFPAKPKQG